MFKSGKKKSGQKGSDNRSSTSRVKHAGKKTKMSKRYK